MLKLVESLRSGTVKRLYVGQDAIRLKIGKDERLIPAGKAGAFKIEIIDLDGKVLAAITAPMSANIESGEEIMIYEDVE